MALIVTVMVVLLVVVAILLFVLTILGLVKKIWEKIKEDKKNPILPLTFTIDNIKIKNEGGTIMLTMKNTQLARFVVGSPKDAKGEDTTIEAGSLKVTSSNEEVFTVAPDELQPENNTAFKVVAGRSGAAVLKIEADADLGEGVKTISKEIAVEVTTSEAVGFGEPSFSVEDQDLSGGQGAGNAGSEAGAEQG